MNQRNQQGKRPVPGIANACSNEGLYCAKPTVPVSFCT